VGAQPGASLARTLLADGVSAIGVGVYIVVALGPWWIADGRDVPWYWEVVAFVVPFAMLIAVAKPLIRGITRYGGWIKDIYERANGRRDLSFTPGPLSMLETVLVAIFAIPPLAVLVLPIVPLTYLAYRRWEWMHSVTGDIVLLLVIMLILLPLSALATRLVVYAAINVARRISGSPMR